MGLGNPGDIYIDSRHNIGFSILDALGRIYKVKFKKEKTVSCLSAKCKLANDTVLLAMPLTFMNLSGMAVDALLKKYRLDLDRLLVVCDDLTLEFGRLKIRPYGLSGGHQGLKSIIDALKSERFSRLRIGIGRPQSAEDLSDYVLSPFTLQEKRQIKAIIKKAIACCGVWVLDGISKSMNIFNPRSQYA